MDIELKKYDSSWSELFKQESDFLLEIIGSWLTGSIEHIGSTSVKGMLAKPIIDIMFGVKCLESSRKAIKVLQENGYCYYPYKPDVMHWFCKPSPENRTHHLHLVPYESALWKERITFRNALRASSELALEYESLKVTLASKFKTDREAYTEKKWPFIQKVLKGQNS